VLEIGMESRYYGQIAHPVQDENLMNGATFKPLDTLPAAELKRLASGYTTTQTYHVRRSETHEHTLLALELADLSAPYTKRFAHPAGLLGYYRSAVKHGLSLGAYAGDMMIGIAITDLQAWNGSLLLWEFHVAPSHQGRGVGRGMMERLAAMTKDAGLRVITVETSSTNVPAITFYRRVGFAIESIDLSYYSNDDLDRGEVAVFMKRKV